MLLPAGARRAEHADLLIVNHALFFSDLALRAEGVGFLPPYDHVILDEAHMVEDVASDHFGVSVTESRVRFLLSALINRRTGRGFLATLNINEQALMHRVVDQVDQVERAANHLFDELVRYQEQSSRRNGRIDEENIVENVLSEPLEALALLLSRLRDKVEDEPNRYALAYIGRCNELAAAPRRFWNRRCRTACTGWR